MWSCRHLQLQHNPWHAMEFNLDRRNTCHGSVPPSLCRPAGRPPPDLLCTSGPAAQHSIASLWRPRLPTRPCTATARAGGETRHAARLSTAASGEGCAGWLLKPGSSSVQETRCSPPACWRRMMPAARSFCLTSNESVLHALHAAGRHPLRSSGMQCCRWPPSAALTWTKRRERSPAWGPACSRRGGGMFAVSCASEVA